MDVIKEYFRDWKVTYGITEVDYFQPIFIIHLCYFILSITISLFFTFNTFIYIFTPYLVINLIPTISLMIRRLNELNIKPIILIFWLIPIVGWLYLSFILLSEPWEYEQSKTLSSKEIIEFKNKTGSDYYKRGPIIKMINHSLWSKLKK